MKLTHVPLLQVQRDLYALPRGMERFHEYLRTMVGGTDDVHLPLMAMNPMGREHVAERLDAWLDLGAEVVAERALGEAEERLSGFAATFRAGLVIADDVRGSWTNRFTSDFSQRFECEPLLKRGWVTTVLWAREAPDRGRLAQEVLAAVYRASHLLRFGRPKTLRAMLVQEGRAAAFAGMKAAAPPEAVDQTRKVLAPLLEATDHPTCLVALFGDVAAEQLGHAALGLPTQAGLALAAAEASATEAVEALR